MADDGAGRRSGAPGTAGVERPDWMDHPEMLQAPVDPDALDLPPARVPGGWALPVPRTSPGYLYITGDSVAFELWMGGDFDVTVRFRGPFDVALPGTGSWRLEAAAGHRGALAPMVRIRDHQVAAARASDAGELEISLEGGGSLAAFPTRGGWEITWPLDDGPAWVVTGREGTVEVKSRPPTKPTAPVDRRWSFPDPAATSGALPIRGRVAQVDVSGTTVELEVPIEGDHRFCIHLAAGFELRDRGRRVSVNPATLDPDTLGPFLDLIGRSVTEAHAVGGRLALGFSDGARVETAVQGWEAHWPASPEGFDEWWVPEDGPRFP